VHPIAVRKGMRLFDEGEPPIPFALISAQTFKTGVLSLVYASAEAAGNISLGGRQSPLAPARTVELAIAMPPHSAGGAGSGVGGTYIPC
jgi:hypothetical protein